MSKPNASSTVVPMDLPPSVHGAYNWAVIADKLRAQPNQWHLVFTNDLHSRSVSVRQGNVKSMSPVIRVGIREEDAFEFATRNNRFETDESGKKVRYCDLHARYVPPKRAKKRSNA